MSERPVSAPVPIQKRVFVPPTAAGYAARVILTAGSPVRFARAVAVGLGVPYGLDFGPMTGTITQIGAYTDVLGGDATNRRAPLYIASYARPDGHVVAALWYVDDPREEEGWLWDNWAAVRTARTPPRARVQASAIVVHGCAWVHTPDPDEYTRAVYAKWFRYALERSVYRTAELLAPNEAVAAGHWESVRLHDADAYGAFVQWHNYQLLTRVGDI